MKKLIILFLTLILIETFFFILLVPGFTGKVVENQYMHTKAICNEDNYCQDYEIACKGNKFISSKPITGAAVQHSQNWKDPRNNAKNLCE